MINKNSSIKIIKHKSKHTFDKLLKLVNNLISNSQKLLFLNLEIYRKSILEIQDKVNVMGIQNLIFNEIKNQVFKYMKTESLLIQSFSYLRVTRPVSENTPHSMEAIPFHRESFYGKNLNKVFNIWTPIFGKNTSRTMLYVPNSQLIPDNKIKVIKEIDPYTKKKSSGHKLGFLYQPKQIISGVNLNLAKPMKVGFGYSSIFSGNLIHGPKPNVGKDLRISVDFKIIKKKDYKIENSKHITSNKPYFVSI